MMQNPPLPTYMPRMKNTFVFRAFAALILVTFSFAVQAHDKAHASDEKQGQVADAYDHMDHMVVALPNGLTVKHPVLLVSGPAAKSAAAFMVIGNSSESDDRLIAAEADFANTVQLHTHIMDNGIAKMREVEGGFEIAAGGSHELVRGGDHVMLMGLQSVPVVGETVSLTLIFENAGAFTIPFMVQKAGAMTHDNN